MAKMTFSNQWGRVAVSKKPQGAESQKSVEDTVREMKNAAKAPGGEDFVVRVRGKEHHADSLGDLKEIFGGAQGGSAGLVGNRWKSGQAGGHGRIWSLQQPKTLQR